MLTCHKTRRPAHFGEYRGYAMANYFILSSSSVVCAVKNERETQRAEFTTAEYELSFGAR